jgi:hypothetical protein
MQAALTQLAVPCRDTKTPTPVDITTRSQYSMIAAAESVSDG